MNTHADKTQENKSQAVSTVDSQIQSSGESTFQFVDNRPEAITQRQLQEIANNSPQVSQLRAFQEMANNSPQAKQSAQLQAMANNHSSKEQQPFQKKENNTGLPDNLKTGMENLSGMPLDDVKVHRNSDKPAQLQAHAYAQGTDIHLGPGQEKHLPHETWHVVQQKQGRVKPTMQMKGKVNVNDDVSLEKEADVMGARALLSSFTSTNKESTNSQVMNSKTIQRLVWYEGGIPEFQVDGAKPTFMGAVKAMAVGVGSRNHIIPYAAIENDTAVLLNNWLANPAIGTAAIQNLTEALFVDKTGGAASYQTMLVRRATLFTTLGTASIADYQTHVRALVSALNSSSDNVRPGDSSINSSIGENLDVDFLPGTITVPPAGLPVVGNGGPVTLAGGTEYLRLEPNSEQILYNYQINTTQDLSFVFGALTNTQLSSLDAPQPVGGGGAATVAGKVVVVFDVGGGGVPFCYS
jgi:hypothetical protein